MGDKSKIEWTDATWNPIRGCSRVSSGCKNCYAERVAARFSGPGQPYEGLVGFYFSETRWNGKVRFIEDKLDDPLRWKKPRRIFVNSMSDLFHENVPFETIKKIWDVIVEAQIHTFQILTKRPKRMLEFSKWLVGGDDLSIACWPRNSWLGVSVEDQKTADERIPLLLNTPAAVRWVSYEPALGPVSIPYFLRTVSTAYAHLSSLDWVVCGGESGPNARPMHPEWALSALRQCQDAGVPFFFKQWGEWRAQPGYSKAQLDRGIGFQRVGKKRAGRLLDGREWNEYPEVKG